MLDRPGRPLVREDFSNTLLAALVKAGAGQDVDLELSAVTAPLLPVGALVRTDVLQMDYDAGTGRFTAMLTVAAGGSPPNQVRVSGRTIGVVELPVLRRRMHPGDVVSLMDFEWARLRLSQARGDLVGNPRQADGLVLRHTVQQGQPVQVNDLTRPVVVQKGAAIMLSLDGPGIELTAQGIALASAGLGERVRVQNPLSRVIVEAEVTSPGRARVTVGSMPVTGSRQVAVQ